MERIRPWYAAAVVGVLAVLLLGVQSSPGVRLLNDLGVLPVPDHYTALSFNAANSLPQSAVPGQALVFAFIIANDEGASRVYSWQVTESADAAAAAQIDAGSIRVANQASNMVTATATMPAAMPTTGQRVTITVNLPQIHQDIHFSVELERKQ